MWPIVEPFELRLDVIIATAMTMCGFASIWQGVGKLRGSWRPGLGLSVIVLAYAGTEVKFTIDAHRPVATGHAKDRGSRPAADTASNNEGWPAGEAGPENQPRHESRRERGAVDASSHCMAPEHYYAFAILKVLFTVALLGNVLPPILLRRHRSQAGFLKRLLGF